MEAKIFNKIGKESGKIDLPASLFGVKWNDDLVYQVAIAMQANKRRSVADTKDRGEVRGGGKKPWRQKGTGRARHGSSRSPIWIGGGITHGPKAEKDYSQKINKKMKLKAFFTVLSRKLADNEIIWLDSLTLEAPKTKEGQTCLNNLAKSGFDKINYKTGNRALLATPKVDQVLVRSFKNIPSASVLSLRDLNVLDLLNYKYLVITDPEESLSFLKVKAKSE